MISETKKPASSLRTLQQAGVQLYYYFCLFLITTLPTKTYS